MVNVSCENCVHINTCKYIDTLQRMIQGFNEQFADDCKFPFEAQMLAQSCKDFLIAKNLKVDLQKEMQKEDKLQ